MERNNTSHWLSAALLITLSACGGETIAVGGPPPAAPSAPTPADTTAAPAAEPVAEEEVRPKDARSAAWLALAQALYGSAEFRYLR